MPILASLGAGAIGAYRMFRVAPILPDSFFNQVTLLLPGTGTNGAQNNTFLDSSSNAFTITRNGNTTQGTFTPYGDNWSNYFNGGSDRISNASASVMDFGTGNFTVEMWVFLTSTADQMFFEGPSNTGFQFFLQSGVLYAGTSAVVTAVSYTLPSGFANSWHHICVVREGTGSNQTSLYVDGVRQSQGTLSTNYTTTGFQISRTSGYLVFGYISNLRVVKGTAVYTGASLTVPTAPLTAISGTSLLTCQSNRFIDNSSNAFALTVAGNTSVQRFSPFSPTAAYTPQTIGGSGYFDGTGDQIYAPQSTSFDLGAGDWTMEAWIYPTGVDYGSAGFQRIFSKQDVNYYFFRLLNGTGYLAFGISTGNFGISSSVAPARFAWSHVAAVRSVNTITLYLNGVSVASDSYSSTPTADNAVMSISGYNISGTTNELFTGYISNARFVKGTAVYTTGFTPPTSPVTAITNTSLLCNFTNAGIIDNAMMNDLETVGNAQISTSVSKFGGSSMYFDGTGDYLVTPSSQQYVFGTGNFTVECWVYFSGAIVDDGIFHISPTQVPLNVTTGISVGAFATGGSQKWALFAKGVQTDSALTTISTGVWYHVAVVRNGTTTTLYVDGSSVATASSDTTDYTQSYAFIGGYYGSGYLINGYIDDFRITKGVARYTANFTAPTAPFPTQ